MVAHEKRNPAQLFCAVPTQNDLALSSLLFSDHPTQKLEYPTPRSPHVSFRASAHTGVGIRSFLCRVVSAHPPLHSKKRTTAVIRFLVL